MANTKSSVGQHGPPTNAMAGSGATEEYKHPQLTGHTRRAPLVEIRYTGLPFVRATLETSMKQIIQHMGQ
jgi:hypothetical protein